MCSGLYLPQLLGSVFKEEEQQKHVSERDGMNYGLFGRTKYLNVTAESKIVTQ